MKKLLWSIGLLLLLIISLLVSLPFWFKVDHLRAPLISLLENRFDAKVSIQKLSLKMSPTLLLELDKVSVAKPETATEPLLQADQVAVQFNLRSLWRRKPEGSLRIKHPLIILPANTTNQSSPLTPSTDTAPSPLLPAWLTRIHIQRITIEQGQLLTGSTPPLHLGNINATLSGINLSKTETPIEVELTANLMANESRPQSLNLAGQILVNLAEHKVTLAPTAISLAGSTLQIGGEWGELSTVTLSSDSFPAEPLLAFLPTDADSLPFYLAGNMGLNLSWASQREKSSLKLALKLRDTELKYGSVFSKEADLPCDLTLEGTRTESGFALSAIHFNLNSFSLDGTGQIAQDGKLEVTLTTPPTELHDLLPFLTASKSVLTGPATLQLDVTGPATKPIEWEYAGTLKSDSLHWGAFPLTKTEARFTAVSDTLTLKTFDADLPKGHLGGSGSVKLGTGEPSWDLALNLSHIELAPLWEQLFRTKINLNWAGTLTLNAKGEGKDIEAVKKTMTGDGKFVADAGDWPLATNITPLFSNAMTKALQLAPPSFWQQLQVIPLKKTETPFTLTPGLLQFPSLVFEDDNHSVELNGPIALTGQLQMVGTYRLSKLKSDTWIPDSKLRSLLADTDGRYHLLFSLTGPLTAPTLTPDPTFLQTQTDRITAEIPLPSATETPAEALDKTIDAVTPNKKGQEKSKKKSKK